jgi:hypothetical protein
MKTIFTFFLAFALFANAALAQITLTAEDVALAGLSLSNVQDTLPDASIVAGPGGQDKTWDFSALHSHEVYSFESVEAEETPYFDKFPNADVAIIENGETYGYLQKDALSLKALGFYGAFEFEPGVGLDLDVHIQPFQSLLRFPTVFNDGFTEHFQRVIEYDASLTGQPADSIRIVSSVLRTVVYDAYGNLTTPAGSFPVLRVKETETSTDTLYVLFDGSCLTLPSNETVTDISYNFWTKQGGIGYPVASIQADEFGNTVSASWLKDFTSPARETAGKIQLDIFPNPAAQWLNVQLPEHFTGQLEIYDAGSRMVASQPISSHLEQIDLKNLRPGTYILVAKDGRNKLAGYRKFEVVMG